MINFSGTEDCINKIQRLQNVYEILSTHGVKIKHLDLKDETITETEVTLIIVPTI